MTRDLPDGARVSLTAGHQPPGTEARGQHVGTGCLWLQKDGGAWRAVDRHRSQYMAWQWIQICDTWAEVCDALDIPEVHR